MSKVRSSLNSKLINNTLPLSCQRELKKDSKILASRTADSDGWGNRARRCDVAERMA